MFDISKPYKCKHCGSTEFKCEWIWNSEEVDNCISDSIVGVRVICSCGETKELYESYLSIIKAK